MHPSWPSGHSLEGHMVALALAEVRPDAEDMLVALADRIGKNREIAGVHYRSDTYAGKEIAKKALPYLQQCAKFGELVTAAKAEHASAGAPPP
jgi:acid phosphatase (class A)